MTPQGKLWNVTCLELIGHCVDTPMEEVALLLLAASSLKNKNKC